MHRFELTVPITPVQWQHHTGYGKRARSPDKMKAYKETVGTLAAAEMRGRPMLTPPLRFHCKCFFPRPSHRPHGYPARLKWTKDAKDMPFLFTPDWVNLAKLAEDAVVPIVCGNDRLVYDGGCEKYYADHGDEARIEIVVEEV